MTLGFVSVLSNSLGREPHPRGFLLFMIIVGTGDYYGNYYSAVHLPRASAQRLPQQYYQHHRHQIAV